MEDGENFFKGRLRHLLCRVLLESGLHSGMWSLSEELQCIDRLICAEAMIMVLQGLLRARFPTEC